MSQGRKPTQIKMGQIRQTVCYMHTFGINISQPRCKVNGRFTFTSIADAEKRKCCKALWSQKHDSPSTPRDCKIDFGVRDTWFPRSISQMVLYHLNQENTCAPCQCQWYPGRRVADMMLLESKVSWCGKHSKLWFTEDVICENTKTSQVGACSDDCDWKTSNPVKIQCLEICIILEWLMINSPPELQKKVKPREAHIGSVVTQTCRILGRRLRRVPFLEL